VCTTHRNANGSVNDHHLHLHLIDILRFENRTMDKRERAHKILEQARDLLAERLIDDVIESADGIIEDAEGLSYMDEIGLLQEKIGSRLGNVNSMLANLPAAKPATPKQAASNSAAPTGYVAKEDDAGSKTAANAEADADTAESQPGRNTDDDVAKITAAQPVTFALFGQQIIAGDLDQAGWTLSELLDVDPKVGLRCATAFRDRLNEDPMTIQKAMSLRARITEGKHNDSLMILWDCFGLQGLEAIAAINTLRASLSAA